MNETVVAIGRIKGVEKLAAKGVFLDVDLMYHHDRDGVPYQARCRLCTPLHGVGYGLWHVPDLETPVLCIFPGPATKRDPGGDLDEGYAFAFASFTGEPPVDGLQGVLDAARVVYKGRPATDHDFHLQGKHDLKVDAADTRDYQGTRATVTVGAETRENKATFDWTFRGIAQFLGDVLVRIQTATDLILTGTAKVSIDSGTLIELVAPTINLIATNVYGGATASALKVLTEVALATYNSHTHPGDSGGTTGTPNQTMAVGTDTTTKFKAV